jgi:hypothetical protein
MSSVYPANYASFLGTKSVSDFTSTVDAGASVDPLTTVIAGAIGPVFDLVDDAITTPEERAASEIAATQAAANLAAAQSGATTAAAAEATKQQAIKYAFAAALVLAAVWAFSRRR